MLRDRMERRIAATVLFPGVVASMVVDVATVVASLAVPVAAIWFLCERLL